MKAMFNTVKEFAVFNSKPHLFNFGEPYQAFCEGEDEPVYIDFISGSEEQFKSRVEQFGGLTLGL